MDVSRQQSAQHVKWLGSPAGRRDTAGSNFEVQRLVGDERYLVLDALSDRQPVKWAEEWPCIRSSTTLTNYSCQIILRPLKFVNCRHWSSVEKIVTVIEPWCHDAACYRLCHIIRQEFTDVTKRADVVVAHTDDWINMFVKAQMWI